MKNLLVTVGKRLVDGQWASEWHTATYGESNKQI